jgi:hypothetical protein
MRNLIRTMAMLEKLLGTRSFNTTVGHLTHYQVTSFVFWGGEGGLAFL